METRPYQPGDEYTEEWGEEVPDNAEKVFRRAVTITFLHEQRVAAIVAVVRIAGHKGVVFALVSKVAEQCPVSMAKELKQLIHHGCPHIGITEIVSFMDRRFPERGRLIELLGFKNLGKFYTPDNPYVDLYQYSHKTDI